MMLALDQAGAQHSQSPVGADMRDGDGTSMLFRFAESVVNIAHIGKVKFCVWNVKLHSMLPLHE
jgi:hypothetical protein